MQSVGIWDLQNLKNFYNMIGNAYEKYPLALALHEADLEATYLLESKNN